jgi:deoxyadenosine/deoxycytidine kinase
MRVAIVGGPGIGKSTLVRQLGDLYHHGSYGEGEGGVWEPGVLEDIDAGLNPVGVTAYFAALYDANYRDAAANDGPERVIFIEGARIILTSSTQTIDRHIRQRNRPHEEVENMVRRFRLIDAEFRRLAPRHANTVVIDRDDKEFHERTSLLEIIRAADLPPFPQIPYRRMERFDEHG